MKIEIASPVLEFLILSNQTLDARGGHFTRPDLINFRFGSGLKPDRIETYKPDRVVIGSGQTRPDPNTRSGSQKKNNDFCHVSVLLIEHISLSILQQQSNHTNNKSKKLAAILSKFFSETF